MLWVVFFFFSISLKIPSVVNEINILDNIQIEEESCKAALLILTSIFVFKT